MLAFLGWKALDLALEAFFLAVGEVSIASPYELASQDEATWVLSALALPLEVSLALHSSALTYSALTSSEAEIASLLPPMVLQF